MAKNTLWQWSTSAASNTDVNSIDISGAGLVKNGDNAMREIMAQLISAESKGSNVASATTTTLGTGRFFHITGTTTITDIDFTDPVDGRWAILEFDGALILTHNATTLTLPGGANITTAAGDRALIVQDSGDNIHVLFYQRYATGPDSSLLIAGGQTVTGGFSFTALNGGTISTGTVTPNPASQNYQYYTNNGAHTLAAPSSDCAIDILITNGASAGAITFSGFTVASGNTGDALTTTNTNKFVVSIRRINGTSTYVIKALQ